MSRSNDPRRMQGHTLTQTLSDHRLLVDISVSEPVTHLFPRRVCHHSSDPITLEAEQNDSPSRSQQNPPSENR